MTSLHPNPVQSSTTMTSPNPLHPTKTSPTITNNNSTPPNNAMSAMNSISPTNFLIASKTTAAVTLPYDIPVERQKLLSEKEKILKMNHKIFQVPSGLVRLETCSSSELIDDSISLSPNIQHSKSNSSSSQNVDANTAALNNLPLNTRLAKGNSEDNNSNNDNTYTNNKTNNNETTNGSCKKKNSISDVSRVNDTCDNINHVNNSFNTTSVSSSGSGSGSKSKPDNRAVISAAAARESPLNNSNKSQITSTNSSSIHHPNHKDYVPILEYNGMFVCPTDFDIGCGNLNHPVNLRCQKCDRYVITKETSSGDRFRLGQVIFFTRKNGSLIDKGILIGIAMENNLDVVRVRYYEKAFRVSRYDENVPLTHIYHSMSDEAIGTRVRKQTVLTDKITAQFVNGDGLAHKPKVHVMSPTLMRGSSSSTSTSSKSMNQQKSPTSSNRKRKRAAKDTRSVCDDDSGSGSECDLSTLDDTSSVSTSDDSGKLTGDKNRKILSPVAPPPPPPPELDIDSDNLFSSDPYNPSLRERYMDEPVSTIDTATALSCIRFPCFRSAVGRLDRGSQRALLHRLIFALGQYELHRSTVDVISGNSNEGTDGIIQIEEQTVPSTNLFPSYQIPVTLRLLEEIIAGCPLNEEELYMLPTAAPYFATPRRQDMSALLAAIQDFLRDRFTNCDKSQIEMTSGLYWLDHTYEIPSVLLQPPELLTIEDLAAMNLSLPLSYYQFRVAMRLAYDKLGGREVVEGMKGVRGMEPTPFGTLPTYSNMYKSLLNDT